MAVVTPDDLAAQQQDVNRLFRHQKIALAVIALLFSVAWLYLTILPERPGRALMRFTQAVTIGPTALCPGETLHYDLGLMVNRGGVFDLDVAVWRVTPPATVVFSSSRRMVFDGPAEYRLAREWTVPAFYSSPLDGSPEHWAAGNYERRHAISTVSRSTEPSIVTIPFSIRGDCE